MAMLEYLNCSFGDENYKRILTLREQNEKDKKAFHRVCVIGETIIACGSLVENEKGVFEIYGLFVQDHYNFNGLGTNIVKCFKNKAKEMGATEIFANVPISVIRFFEKNGFCVDGVSFPSGDTRFVKCSHQFVFDDALWVSFGGEKDAVIARKDFFVDNIKETFLYATGLGFCEIYINGKKISDRLLAPAWTNFKDHDTASYSQWPLHLVYSPPHKQYSYRAADYYKSHNIRHHRYCSKYYNNALLCAS